VDLGNIVSPQTSLLVVDAFDPAEVVFSLPEKHLPLIRRNFETAGLPVTAVTKEGKKVTGMVTFIGNVDSSTGTVPLTAEFANEGFPLWPGEYMNVEIQLDIRSGVVTVPNRAVMLGPDGPFVYVVDAQKTAHMRLVKTDLETKSVTIVSEGLEKGESVVLEGHVRLKNGVPVRIAGEEAKTPKAGL
jgi:multidrug efflux system membrane fusion protein